jgi:hypothetical protein
MDKSCRQLVDVGAIYLASLIVNKKTLKRKPSVKCITYIEC